MKAGELGMETPNAKMDEVGGTIPPRSGTMPPRSGTMETSRWLDDLIASEHLHVAFQPIVDLNKGEIVGREVLGRIGPGAVDAHERGATGPQQLLQMAHDHGKLVAVDRRFREIGIETLARAENETGVFFLNVDPRVIDDPEFSAGFTRKLLEEWGVAPTRIVLELTETDEVLESARLERLVHHYASQGFRIALDDVGAGYASLTALIRVRPHFLKLDKALVRGLADDPLRSHLVRSLADFGRRAGIQVIAEGIEDEADLFALLTCGVELGQGYLLARPHPIVAPLAPDVYELLVRTSRRCDRSGQSTPPPRTVGAFIRAHAPVHQTTPAEEVAALLRPKPIHSAIAVVDDEGRAVGLVVRERLFAELAHLKRGGRRIGELMDPHPLRLEGTASVEVALRLCTSRDETHSYDPVVVQQDGRYLGLITMHALMRAVADGGSA